MNLYIFEIWIIFLHDFGNFHRKNLDVFEMARLRMQAPVRRPSSKEIADPINLQNIREFNELKYKG